MPWSPRDVKKHKKGVEGKEARKWSHIANSMKERGHDDATAIRAASGKTKRKGNLPNKGAIQRRMARRGGR